MANVFGHLSFRATAPDSTQTISSYMANETFINHKKPSGWHKYAKGKVSTLPLYLLIPTVSQHFCLFKNKLDSFLCRIRWVLPAAQQSAY